MAEKKTQLDAGLAVDNHYKIRLVGWRYDLRQRLLPIVRGETPYVAYVQEKLRSPTLDSYFAMSANLGTHTAFMVVLPILFWCGFMSMGRAMVHILAAGVFFSGFVKDLLCLPRPLSPPLTRITMSGSAALEYGFPSTHSTNAVSVAYYALNILKYDSPDISPRTNLFLQVGLYAYAVSITLGRLYCGMHGFFDIVIGSLLGAGLGAIQYQYGPTFDDWLYPSSIGSVTLLVIAILVAVRIHPEPADDCPCFDDSVAFAGVVIGIEYASWTIVRTGLIWQSPPNIPFDLQKQGLLIATLRILLGILIIFAWRATMKPLLLKVLPPIFRVIESLGIDSPRRFFIRASQYSSVPRQRHDDNVIPSAGDIPQMLSNLRRTRAISVGPQSEADARETIAVREKQRSSSKGRLAPLTPSIDSTNQNGYFASGVAINQNNTTPGRNETGSIETLRRQMGTGIETLSPNPLYTPGIPQVNIVTSHDTDRSDEQELLASVQKPRVRYDVEVVTKLVVYAGIGYIAAAINPMIFHAIGWSI